MSQNQSLFERKSLKIAKIEKKTRFLRQVKNQSKKERKKVKKGTPEAIEPDLAGERKAHVLDREKMIKNRPKTAKST